MGSHCQTMGGSQRWRSRIVESLRDGFWTEETLPNRMKQEAVYELEFFNFFQNKFQSK